MNRVSVKLKVTYFIFIAFLFLQKTKEFYMSIGVFVSVYVCTRAIKYVHAYIQIN